MYNHLVLIFKIFIFKKNPEDIPYSINIFRVSLIGYAIISFALLQSSSNELNALIQVLVEIIIILSFSFLALTLSNLRERFIQTSCALLGTDILASLFAMPAFATLTLNNNSALAIMTIFGLIIWHYLVTAHIIRHALSQSISFALGIAFLYIFSAYQIIGVLFIS